MSYVDLHMYLRTTENLNPDILNWESLVEQYIRKNKETGKLFGFRFKTERRDFMFRSNAAQMRI